MDENQPGFKTVEEYLSESREQVIKIAEKIVTEIENKIEGAPLNQLTSALGTILDKFGANENQEGLLAKVFEDFEDVV